jgi:MoaA/NifB/PqqE/SkfB family radical SAM enzyme
MGSKISGKLVRNMISNVVRTKLGKEPIKPIFVTYYTNISCNAACTYCNYVTNGATKNQSRLSTDKTLQLMGIVKKSVPNIYFTGGEPLLRPDIEEVTRGTKDLGFKIIGLNSNMSLIDKRQGLLDDITQLVASYDTNSIEKNSQLWGVTKKFAERVKENIVTCAGLQDEKDYTMTLNCVVTPDSIPEAHDVLDFCKEHGIQFAIVPAELKGGQFNPELKDNPKYKELISRVLDEKRGGAPVFGSRKYFETISEFKDFRCFPLLTPHIDHEGHLHYPCQTLGKRTSSSILELGSLEKAIEQGEEEHGGIPSCGNICHKACYIGPSIVVQNPFRAMDSL